MVAARAVLASLVLASCALDGRDDFERDVLPTLEQRCFSAACHGVGPGDAWPEAGGLFVRVGADGRVADAEEVYAAALARVSTAAPRSSTLVRVPMPAWAGGGPHAGAATYTGPDDPAVVALLDWIAREERGGEDVALTDLEAQFAAEVAPVLVERCARGGCHGPRDVAFSAFPLHPDPIDGRIAPADIPAARLAARKHLDLWGADPARARLIRKAIGLAAGGLFHRGNAGTFFPEAPPGAPLDAPGMQAILRWAHAERAALGVEDGRAPSALIWVEGPAAPRAPFRIEPGPTGSDLFMARWPALDDAENLTAALHPGEDVEIRDPALSHDGARVAFAMRRGAATNFAIIELELATRAWRTIADGPGSFVEPVHAADGRWIAAWDGHGEVSADGPGVAPELVAIGPDGALERLTFTPIPEVSPAFLAAGKTRGQLVFGTRREGPRGPEAVLFRFPLCHDANLHGEPEYHVQHGASLAPWAPRTARDLPDGRQLVVVLPSATAPDDRGALVVLDRSLGPTLQFGQTASLGGFRDPIEWVDADPRFRDPAPLPDGRAIVVDGDGLALLDLEAEPRLSSLRAVAGVSLRSPVPVFARPDEDDGHALTTDPAGPTGFLALRDVAVLEALFGRAEPRGARPLRDDLYALRLLAAEPRPAGTWVGASRAIPARVLAEVPLAADRSLWLRVPARTPILLQLLDARGMVVGRQLDRWYYANGGETIPGGTNAETYASACAGCHGAMSGEPGEAAAPAPDALSSASITLSTHVSRDRRRPLEPLAIEPEGEPVDFASALAPIVRARCDGCHDGALDYARLVAHVDLETLRARRSPLVERLAGEELDAVGSPDPRCPPADEATVRAFARWIEAGALEDVTGSER